MDTSRMNPRSRGRRRTNSSPPDASDSDEEQAASELAAMRRRPAMPWWALDRFASGGPASMPPGSANANPNVPSGRGSPSGIENDLMPPNAGPVAEPAVQPPSMPGRRGQFTIMMEIAGCVTIRQTYLKITVPECVTIRLIKTNGRSDGSWAAVARAVALRVVPCASP